MFGNYTFSCAAQLRKYGTHTQIKASQHNDRIQEWLNISQICIDPQTGS